MFVSLFRPRPWTHRFLAFLLGSSLLAALVLASNACTQVERFDYDKMFGDIATLVILPTYAEFNDKAQVFAQTISAFCQKPNLAGLDKAQQAWRTVRSPWKRSQAFRWGPARDQNFRPSVDWWPIKGDKIDAILRAKTPLDATALNNQGTSTKGFVTVAYLLFNEKNSNETTLKAFAPTKESGKRRCQYLTLLAKDIQQRTAALYKAWDPKQGNFVAQVSDANKGTKAFASGKQFVDQLVNQMNHLMQKVVESKLGKPMGEQSGGTPQPQLLETHNSGNSLQDIIDNIAGIQALYLGKGRNAAGKEVQALSVKGLLAQLQYDALNTKLTQQFEQALTALNKVKAPLRAHLADPETKAALTAVKTLQVTMNVEVVSALGVTISFSDNDGD